MAADTPAGITGIGGVFFKSADQPALLAWYRDTLGIPMEKWGAIFKWSEGAATAEGQTVLSITAGSSTHYPTGLMINFRVHNLEAYMARLQAAGVRTDAIVADPAYGNFAWAYDPDGNKIELWEPAPEGS